VPTDRKAYKANREEQDHKEPKVIQVLCRVHKEIKETKVYKETKE
jgi:hypothetical protein